MSYLWSAYAVFVIMIHAGDTVRCYKCEAQKSMYISEQDNALLCRHFDGSEQYIVDCPYSTMCIQEHMSLDMENGFKTESSKRHCAPQTEKDAQLYIDGVGWRYIKPIHEIYNEGCTLDEFREKTTKTKICYCRGDLCNGGDFGNVNSKLKKHMYDFKGLNKANSPYTSVFSIVFSCLMSILYR